MQVIDFPKHDCEILPQKGKFATELLPGHFNYCGVHGNSERLQQLVGAAKEAWFTWLRRRGQRSPLTWKRYQEFL